MRATTILDSGTNKVVRPARSDDSDLTWSSVDVSLAGNTVVQGKECAKYGELTDISEETLISTGKIIEQGGWSQIWLPPQNQDSSSKCILTNIDKHNHI